MNYTYHDIEQYLSGEMNTAELQQFEAQLKTDEQLQKQVTAYKMLQTTISKHQQAEETLPELKAILQPLTKQYFQQKQQSAKVFSIKRMVYVLAAAASIALILFLAIPGVNVDGYPIDDMSGAIVRGSETDLAKAMSTAAKFYNNKNYVAAADVLQQLKEKSPNDAVINYHLGISLLKQQKNEAALELFEALANGQSVYREDANFFCSPECLSSETSSKSTTICAIGKTRKPV